MNRLKITWKWNGEKIREDLEKVIAQAPSGSPWTVTSKASLAKEVPRPPRPARPAFPISPIWNMEAIRQGANRIGKHSPKDRLILFTTLIYQALDGEVMYG